MIDIDYTLVRSRRRSVGLQIQKDATLVIRAPHFVSKQMIENVIREKKDWIEKTRLRMLEKKQPSWSDEIHQTRKIQYLGKVFDLEILPIPCVPLKFKEDRFVVSEEYFPHIKKNLERWYASQAKNYLPERVKYFTQKAGLHFRSIKINGAQTRWGSCSERGTLNFSWRIMMAPVEVIDYVVAHEVAHLKHLNHSRDFWAFVSYLCKECSQSRKWLKAYGDSLLL